MRKLKQPISVLLAVLLLVGSVPFAQAKETCATRGQVADMVLAAADDYNPNAKRSDIIRGYGDGNLDENGPVTRAQALVMLSRAFGTLPTPVGDNARSAYPASNFTDVPEWAKAELANVFDTGIIAGTSATTFSPDENVTIEQMELFISRIFALEGSNLRDDFFATVNKKALDASVIEPGRVGSGTFYDVGIEVTNELTSMVKDIAVNPKNQNEKKLAALYGTIMDKTSRNASGIAPIQPYLDAVRGAKSVRELMQARQKVYNELGCSLLLGFGITADAKNSSVYDLYFSPLYPSLGYDGYESATAEQKSAFLNYITTVLKLCGETETDAAAMAQTIWNTDAELAKSCLSTQELGDVDKTYNLYTMAQLKALFPKVDLDAVFAQTGLTQNNKIVVTDPGEMKAAAALFDDAHLDILKDYCLFSLASSCGGYLNDAFGIAADTFSSEYMGVSGTVSDEEKAATFLANSLTDYMSEAYVDRYFSTAAKKDVENMVQQILSVYRERINALSWMSSATKAKAIKKLDTMKINIGYPDQWRDDLRDAQIKSTAEGGSYFSNAVSLTKAANALNITFQKQGVDKTVWPMLPYTVNACYSPSDNSITFPAAFLQKPFYDTSYSFEKNLGGIGYVIGHEITHAFDNNGAKYDENGNAADWWTASDYAAFETLCNKVVGLYDGREVAPGIACNGSLTLSENIADLGSAACITEIESKRANPDYKALYTAMSEVWCISYPRAYLQYLSRVDVHAPSKLRGSLVMQQFQQFYDAFGIKEGDGMWLAPEKRVTIW